MAKALVLFLVICQENRITYITMFKNYLKISIRNLLRNKMYSLINILGLAVGLTCFILLYLYTSRELNYDNYHVDHENIYRVEGSLALGDKKLKLSNFSSQLASHLKSDVSEVVQTAIVSKGKSALKLGQREIKKPKMFYANQALFDVLTFKPIAGNLNQALIRPNTLVLTRGLAKKFFNSPTKALGKTLTIQDSVSCLVMAVIEDIPLNSHFRPEGLISMPTKQKASPGVFKDWHALLFAIYLKLKPDASIKKVETLANGLQPKKGNVFKNKYKLRALTDIHLYAKVDYEYAEVGSANMVYVLVVIGILILVIASINYMNLATARSVERAKEVGIRKVVGSTRRQLIYQFLIESIFICLLAFAISLSLVELLLPKFNQLTGSIYKIEYTSNPQILLSIIGVVLITGLISGSFPAFVLSRFSPHLVLKGKFSRSQKGNKLRQVLVVVQFSISLVMIVSTLVVQKQIQYVQSKNLGFDKEQLLTIPVPDKQLVLKQKLSQNPNITQVAFGEAMAQFGGGELGVEHQDGNIHPTKVNIKTIGKNWVKTMRIKQLEGRYFDPNLATDVTKSVIVNEAFTKRMAWKKPIGKQITYKSLERKQVTARVIGVIQDFHSESLYKKISPMIFFQCPDNGCQTAYVRVKPANLSQTLAYIQQTYETLYSQSKYSGKFIDQQFAKAYRAEQKRADVFALFSGIAIFIACIGLFGLASFTVSQRSKEIGIRKVLGASVIQILSLLSSSFVRLVFISSLIAFPLAYYFMSQWLQNFAYRTSMPWGVFIVACLVTLLVTLLTVSIQSLRTARINPVQVLKDE